MDPAVSRTRLKEVSHFYCLSLSSFTNKSGKLLSLNVNILQRFDTWLLISQAITIELKAPEVHRHFSLLLCLYGIWAPVHNRFFLYMAVLMP